MLSSGLGMGDIGGSIRFLFFLNLKQEFLGKEGKRSRERKGKDRKGH